MNLQSEKLKNGVANNMMYVMYLSIWQLWTVVL